MYSYQAAVYISAGKIDFDTIDGETILSLSKSTYHLHVYSNNVVSLSYMHPYLYIFLMVGWEGSVPPTLRVFGTVAHWSTMEFPLSVGGLPIQKKQQSCYNPVTRLSQP
jgi:hypothetical protein